MNEFEEKKRELDMKPFHFVIAYWSDGRMVCHVYNIIHKMDF